MEFRPPIDLEYIGVPQGAILTLSDKEEVSAVVVQVSPPKIAYGKEVMTLTKAAKLAYEMPLGETIQVTCPRVR